MIDNERDLFAVLRSLQLPAGDYAVFGSGPLIVRGIIEAGNDLDVLCRGEAWTKATELGDLIHLPEHDVEVVSVWGGAITFGTRWAIGEFDTNELIDSAEVIEGLPFVRLSHVVRYKEIAARPKDLVHLRLLETSTTGSSMKPWGSVSLRNRVDPWGDLHAVPARGLFTGNRGCLVDDAGQLVRHHNGSRWITCQTRFRGWKHPLAAPRTWTPLFFLDDAVASAAGHRPCGLCRRVDYNAFREAVALSPGQSRPVSAAELNRRLAAERHRRGRGLIRAADRVLFASDLDALPTGTVVVDPVSGKPQLVTDRHVQPFAFDGWGPPRERFPGVKVAVLTPATSVAALSNGFVAHLHPTALGHQGGLAD